MQVSHLPFIFVSEPCLATLKSDGRSSLSDWRGDAGRGYVDDGPSVPDGAKGGELMAMLAGAMAALAIAGAAQASDGGSAIDAHVKAAQALAGSDLRTPLFLCRADSGQ